MTLILKSENYKFKFKKVKQANKLLLVQLKYLNKSKIIAEYKNIRREDYVIGSSQ